MACYLPIEPRSNWWLDHWGIESDLSVTLNNSWLADRHRAISVAGQRGPNKSPARMLGTQQEQKLSSGPFLETAVGLWPAVCSFVF